MMARKRRWRVMLIVGIVGLALSAGLAGSVSAQDNTTCEFPVSVEDATGTTVELNEPAAEVVTLDPSSAQVYWEIGAQDRVIGMPVGEYTAYLNGSETKTDITGQSAQDIQVETVIELDPDLVVTSTIGDETTIQQLRDAGIPVYQVGEETSIEAIYEKTRLYGQFIGECGPAEETVTDMQTDIERIESITAERESPRVLYYFLEYTAGENSFIGEVIETAGGENIAATRGVEGFQPISQEVIADEDPAWIITPSQDGVPESEPPFNTTTAVQNDQVLVVNADLISQAGPRVVDPLQTMAEAFYPDANFSAAAVDEETDATTEDEENDTDTPENGTATNTADDPEAGIPQPGFTAPAVLIALFSIALLAGRHT